MSDNRIAKIPKEIAQLQHLRVLDLQNNLISELPAEMLQLKKLTWLKLNNNCFPGAAEKVFDLEVKELLMHLINLQSGGKT